MQLSALEHRLLDVFYTETTRNWRVSELIEKLKLPQTSTDARQALWSLVDSDVVSWNANNTFTLNSEKKSQENTRV